MNRSFSFSVWDPVRDRTRIGRDEGRRYLSGGLRPIRRRRRFERRIVTGGRYVPGLRERFSEKSVDGRNFRKRLRAVEPRRYVRPLSRGVEKFLSRARAIKTILDLLRRAFTSYTRIIIYRFPRSFVPIFRPLFSRHP